MVEQSHEDLLHNNFDEIESETPLSPAAVDFHMILRSPNANALYPSTTPMSKSKKSSKKKAKKTPSKPITEGDVENELIDHFYPEMSVQEQIMQAASRECSPLRPAEIITVPLKSKAFRSHSLGKVVRSSLYAATKSTMVKQRVRNSTGTQPSSLGSSIKSTDSLKAKKLAAYRPKGPTIPVTPHFKCDDRSRMHVKTTVLSTEDREMVAVTEAKKVEELRVKKAKKVFQWVKRHSTNVVKTVIRSTKELTIPTTPASYLMKRKGKKVCSNETRPITKEVEAVEESFHNRAPTQFEPFQFATDSRIKSAGKLRIMQSETCTSSISYYYVYYDDMHASDIYKITCMKPCRP